MSLAKVPFTLGVWWAVWVCLSNPFYQESKKEGDQYKHIGREEWMRKMAVWAPLAAKVVFAAYCCLEVLVLISTSGAPFPLWTHRILSGSDAMLMKDVYLSPTAALAAIISVLGGYTRKRCYSEMGKMFTFEMTVRDDHELITSGPYSIVRHPGYSGMVMVISGALVYLNSSGSLVYVCRPGIHNFVLFWSVFMSFVTMTLLRRVPHEDEAMHRQFGDKWETWEKKVPWRLVPGVY